MPNCNAAGAKALICSQRFAARLKSCPKKKQQCKFNQPRYRDRVLRTPTHRTKTKTSDRWGTVAFLVGRQRRWRTDTKLACLSRTLSSSAACEALFYIPLLVARRPRGYPGRALSKQRLNQRFCISGGFAVTKFEFLSLICRGLQSQRCGVPLEHSVIHGRRRL